MELMSAFRVRSWPGREGSVRGERAGGRPCAVLVYLLYRPQGGAIEVAAALDGDSQAPSASCAS